MHKKILLLSSCLVLSGCLSSGFEFTEPEKPAGWTEARAVQSAAAEDLTGWWKKLGDPALDRLVDLALEGSPDRRLAEARILEARGLKRSARSSLFPQIGASAQAGESDSGAGSDDFYDAGFDASYEVDLFGRNRNTLEAADESLKALEAQYEDVTLTLIAEVARAYIDFRAAQKQRLIAEYNLGSQQRTLSLIQDLNNSGEAPRLDVERAQNLVSTTEASIPEFQRLSDNARLRLTTLTGHLPEALQPMLTMPADIPGVDVAPVLMAPADVLALRPDIRAAQANLAAAGAEADAAAADFFPTLTLGAFFGVTKSALINPAETVWSVAAGAAMTLLDFGGIAGRVDAADARQAQAYEIYRRAILDAVTDVETALTDYAQIQSRRLSLEAAYTSANNALQHSQELFKEGEISFLDVLDSQRRLNEADSAVVTVRAAQAESLVRLYKALGVY